MTKRNVEPSLRRLWAVSAAQFFTIIAVLGAITFGLTCHVQNVYRSAAVHAEGEIEALIGMKTALLEVSNAATPVIYMLDGTGSRERDIAAYGSASRAMSDSFQFARRMHREAGSAERLELMRKQWDAAHAAVIEASTMAPGSLASLLASGSDPFAASFWAHYDQVDMGITDLHDHVGQTLQSQVDTLDRLSLAMLAWVVTAIASALALMRWVSRRITRHVIAPFLTLREAAAELAGDDEAEPIALHSAVNELHELAATLNFASASLRASNDELRRQANSDPLTGLPNRRTFAERLDEALDDPNGLGVAVLFIDLDDFNVVNESLGHAGGDDLLQVTALRLGSLAGADATVARLGGDEFAVVLCSEDVHTAASQLAQRILDSFAEPVIVGGTPITVSCSIGVDFCRKHVSATTADELLRNADFAMYMAKGQGKHRFEVFAPVMHAELHSQMQLKREIGRATERGQLVLEYQPIVDLKSRALLGFEALVRWDHPTRGRISPADFVPVAEDTGDIISIGQWVLQEACRVLAEHHRHQSVHERPLGMSVNVSPVQLAQPDFVGTVIQALRTHGLPPQVLSIEITESVAIADVHHTAGVLERIRELGVKVALDDFGTGFASLRSLHDLPIDVIKIDRSFLVDSASNNASRALLEAIVGLGRSLNKGVIAEGIETIEDLERLKPFDVAGQGYLFAKPLSMEAAVEYLRGSDPYSAGGRVVSERDESLSDHR